MAQEDRVLLADSLKDQLRDGFAARVSPEYRIVPSDKVTVRTIHAATIIELNFWRFEIAPTKFAVELDGDNATVGRAGGERAMLVMEAGIRLSAQDALSIARLLVNAAGPMASDEVLAKYGIERPAGGSND